MFRLLGGLPFDKATEFRFPDSHRKAFFSLSEFPIPGGIIHPNRKKKIRFYTFFSPQCVQRERQTEKTIKWKNFFYYFRIFYFLWEISKTTQMMNHEKWFRGEAKNGKNCFWKEGKIKGGKGGRLKRKRK